MYLLACLQKYVCVYVRYNFMRQLHNQINEVSWKWWGMRMWGILRKIFSNSYGKKLKSKNFAMTKLYKDCLLAWARLADSLLLAAASAAVAVAVAFTTNALRHNSVGWENIKSKKMKLVSLWALHTYTSACLCALGLLFSLLLNFCVHFLQIENVVPFFSWFCDYVIDFYRFSLYTAYT